MNIKIQSLRNMITLFAVQVIVFVPGASLAQAPDRFTLAPNDSIVVVGNTFAEKLAMSGYLEALVQTSHPSEHVSVRHIPWGGDEVGQQHREQAVPDTNSYLAEHQADVIIACFGMSESFAGEDGLSKFETDLGTLIDGWRAGRFSGEEPRIILISPIAHEQTDALRPAARDIESHNESLSSYVDVMRSIATAKNVRFVDLFEPSKQLYGAIPDFTSNGIHPNEQGAWAFAREIGLQLGWISDEAAEPSPASTQALRELAWNKYYHMRFIYRPTNSQYVWGRRVNPYGSVNFPAEQAQLRRMVAARQQAIWDLDKPTPDQVFAAMPTGVPLWEAVPDSSLLPEDQWDPPAVDAKGAENSVGSTTILPPDEFAKNFTVAEGYEVSCFASEQDFPELANALAFKFDDQHRLWVLCSPTYPHLLPGEQPGDKLIVLSDEDNDGKADKIVVFADDLGETIATGFVIDTDSVYVAQSPELLKLTDTDGDGRADRREVVVTGFSMPDSHHQISALEWSPDGGIILIEGTFASTNVETPFGTRRGRGAAVWRYDPRTGRLDALSHSGHPNPWGLVFDDYGAGIFDSTSGGAHFYFSHMINAFDYPRKPAKPKPILNRGRPTAGNEIIASRHFPPEAQGTHLVNQSIGFHGTRWDRVKVRGSGWATEPMPEDLISSTDPNFRPVAVEVGPDGTLFICDWANPLIGHMQYSVRDPRRDHTHARIWRITHTGSDLVEPPAIHDASIEQLFDLLRLPERNTRSIARRKLQAMRPEEVLVPVTNWLATLSPSDPLHDRLVLEGLWIKQGLGIADMDLAATALELPSADVRGAVVRLIRLWLQSDLVDTQTALRLLTRAARDPDMRVRTETVVACGFAEGQEAGVIAQIAAEYETDEAFDVVFGQTIVHLSKYGSANPAFVESIRLKGLTLEAFMAEPWNEAVAKAALRRADVDAEAHLRALETLAPEPAQRLNVLVDAILEASDPGSVAVRLRSLVVGALRGDETEAQLGVLVRHDSVEVRSLGYAALVNGGASFLDMLARDADAAVTGTKMLDDRTLSADEAAAILDAVDGGTVRLTTALELVTRRAEPTEVVIAWFTDRIEAVRDLGLDKWGHQHKVAMAAVRALMFNPEGDWWPLADRYLPVVSVEKVDQLIYGRQVYFDEAIGCVRCHGDRGQGTPGFPPLTYSPWVLGDPKRAATIVIHGLQGEISIAGDDTFSSVMAPLGANLSDEQIANVLTFVRQNFGNFTSAVSEADVAKARKALPSETPIPSGTTVLAAYPLKDDRIALGGGGGFGSSGNAGRTQLRIVLFLCLGLAIIYAVVRRSGK